MLICVVMMQQAVRTVQCPIRAICEFHCPLEFFFFLFIFLTKFLKKTCQVLSEVLRGVSLWDTVPLVAIHVSIKRKYIPVITKIVKGVTKNLCT